MTKKMIARMSRVQLLNNLERVIGEIDESHCQDGWAGGSPSQSSEKYRVIKNREKKWLRSEILKRMPSLRK